jgi:predicted dehydrogenase
MAQHRVGIAGVVHGHVAAHLREWAETEDAEVVAVADPNREERDGYLRRFHLEGIHRYDTIAEMLDSERLEVISVCTQTMRHAEAVVAAAERGVHCIVEKPLTPSLSDADRMLAAANTYGVHVLTTYPSRWPGGLLQSVLTHAGRGALGRIYDVRYRAGGPKPRAADANLFFRWLYDPAENGAGALVDYCCYGVDVACEVLGLPVSVFAVAGRWVRDDLVGDDNARLLLSYPRGVAEVAATWSAYGSTPALVHLAGERGTIALGADGAQLFEEASPRGRSLEPGELPQATPEPSLCAHLIRCLDEGRAPVPWSRIDHHRDVAEVLDAALRSARSGRPVLLPLPLPSLG